MSMKMHMSTRLPYYRMFGYTATILMQTINTYYMLGNFEGNMDDPKIQMFYKFIFRFITCWSFVAQTIHAALGMSCDVLSLTVGDQYKFLNHFKQARDVVFAALVVPFSLTVATVFWPFFLYDRELLLPYYTVKIVGTISNHCIHTAIVPCTLWEIVFQPRQSPSSHKLNLSVMATCAAIYLAVLFATYFEIGQFPYPILTMLYGSIFLVIFLGASISCLPLYYCLQWPVSNALWSGQRDKKH